MVEIKRQTREFGIQPIGVLRTPQAGQSIAEAVVSGADQIYRRSYEIARDQAIKRGGELAAETDINLITTFDANNKLPMAMELTQTMGRFSREAFEKVALQRFEQAIADDIQNTKELMLNRYQDSPKAFEAAFSQYLEGTGANASGFYKQIVVDRGASALEDGRTRLQIAQMNRIRAEAEAAKKKAEEDYLGRAFDIGATNGVVPVDQFNNETNAINTRHNDYVDAGLAPNTKPEFKEKARNAYISGRLSAGMADPNIAAESHLIELFMRSGGQASVLELMSPATKGFIKSIEVMSDIDSPIDYIKFADENKGIFDVSKDVGATLAANAKARSEAEIKAITDNAVMFDASVNAQLDTGIMSTIGEFGSLKEIVAAKQSLMMQASQFSPTTIGRDLYSSLTTKVNNADKQLYEGIVRRVSESLNSRDPSGESLSLFAEALAAGDKAAIFNLIGESDGAMYNLLIPEVNENGSDFSAIAKSWNATGDVVRKKQEQLTKININNASTELKSILGDNTVSLAQKEAFVAEFNKKYGSSTNLDIVEQVQSINSDLSSTLTKLRNEDNLKNFNLGANRISTGTTSVNLTSNVGALNALAAKTGQTGTPAHIDAAEKTVTAAAGSIISNIAALIPNASMRAQQLKAMAVYAKSGNDIDGQKLPPEARAAVDKALGTSTNIEGKIIEADRDKVAERLSAESEAVNKSFELTQKAMQEQTDLESLSKGTFIGTPARMSEMVSLAVGVAIPTDILTRLPANEAEANAVAIMLANKGSASTELLYATSQLLGGSVQSPDQAKTILGYVRSSLLSVDATGRMFVNEGIRRELGGEKAAKLEALVLAAEMAPIGAEGSYIAQVAAQLDNPITDEAFNQRTGYNTPIEMLANIGVPAALVDDFVPLARSLAIVKGGEAADFLAQAVEKRFTKNSNGYDFLTGTSTIHHDPRSFGYELNPFENGVAEIVERFSTPENPLTFTKNNGIFFNTVSVEELQADPNYMPINVVKDLFGNVTEARANLRLAKQVFYGPTPASTTSKPQWQLYAADQNGFVTVIPNSAFTADSLPMAKALGRLMPPESPTLPVEDGMISAEAIAAVLPPDMAEEVQQQKTEAATVQAPSVEAPAQIPASMALTVDQTLVDSISSVLGKNSEAAKLMPMIAESAGKDTGVASGQLRKVIRAMGELRPSPRRDEIVSQLLELQGKLRGQN
jgi:hypothetical protein